MKSFVICIPQNNIISLAGIMGSNPAGGMAVSRVSVVRSFCVGLVTRPEESYRVWFVWVWSWTLENEEALVL
jgi:hypothetical protein